MGAENVHVRGNFTQHLPPSSAEMSALAGAVPAWWSDWPGAATQNCLFRRNQPRRAACGTVRLSLPELAQRPAHGDEPPAGVGSGASVKRRTNHSRKPGKSCHAVAVLTVLPAGSSRVNPSSVTRSLSGSMRQ